MADRLVKAIGHVKRIEANDTCRVKPAGIVLHIWPSTNLQNWSWMGTATEIIPGQYLFQDQAASNWPTRFYRLSVP
jgi:hypothetical protein